ncbi:MAG TPA: DUF2288 domain-containing protein [Pseudomonadales bacterium]
MTDPDDAFQETDAIERAKITLETAAIGWESLLPHFARGAVVAVDGALDLVAVAEHFSRDDADQIKAWMAANQVGKVSDAQAAAWLEQRAEVWAVVIAPWILVQEKRA